MSAEIYQIIAIIIYMVAMLVIGYYAYRKTTNLNDYMLGGRDLGPAVTALSAGAADMSAWLLMGLPGAIYLSGLTSAWIAIGLTIGAYLNWVFVAPRLRVYTEVSSNSITIPSYLDNRLKGKSALLRIASGIIILLFFTFYVSSGMVAGGKFFESSFGLDYHTGLLIVSAVVVAYTLFGGFLAVSYTDFLQGLMMFISLILVPAIGIIALGGFGETVDAIQAVEPNHFSLFAGTTVLGIISTAAWGLGYFGQPHIIVRFMAIKSAREAKSARRIGISWMIFSLLGAIATALVGVAYFNQADQTPLDKATAETVFILLGQAVFHPFIAGLMLAAILAAIMSTISSQLIVTSSALVEDLYKKVIKSDAEDKTYVLYGRIAVLAVSIFAGFLAWEQNETILGLVEFAWAGFGASFGPVILLSLYWRKLTSQGALAGMITGAIVVVVWANIEVLKSAMYEIVPGFILSLIVAVVVSIITYKPNPAIEEEFNETNRLINENK